MDRRGVGDAYAKKIVDGRPYKRKDELVRRRSSPRPPTTRSRTRSSPSRSDVARRRAGGVGQAGASSGPLGGAGSLRQLGQSLSRSVSSTPGGMRRANRMPHRAQTRRCVLGGTGERSERRVAEPTVHDRRIVDHATHPRLKPQRAGHDLAGAREAHDPAIRAWVRDFPA